jgi:Zinc finger, C2H2 type
MSVADTATLSSKNPTHHCEICFKSFTRSSILRDHAAAHRGQRPHNCRSCSARFTRKIDLRNHEREVHGGSRPFICQHIETDGTMVGCGKGFPRSSLLIRHRKGKAAGKCRLRPISMPSGPPVATKQPDPREGELQSQSGAPTPCESLTSAASSVHTDDWMRGHSLKSLIVQTPDSYKICDWYLVTMAASTRAVKLIGSTPLIASLFR